MGTIEISKTRKIAGWVIAGLLTGLFAFSAAGKLALHPEQMEQLKLGDWRIIIAIGEITSALLFLFPRTNIYGTILLSAYMGGAIIIHMTGGLSIVMPTVVLVFIWLGGFVRNPELIKR
ncbi:MAG: DoxX family protein [Bacteroidales bacterium]|nr:DoxX family protein [Bacteroidales bacterium]